MIENEFWKRQFSEEITPLQNWFDVAFGVIVPILWLVFDPIVFRDSSLGVGGKGYLSHIRLFAYISIGFGIITLSIWLLSRNRRANILVGFISGILLASSLLAMALGVYILPVSLLGLFLGLWGLLFATIGILGFIPFLTAFVFLRNGIRAVRITQPYKNKILLSVAMLIGIIFVVGVPFCVQWKASKFVSQSIYTIIHGDKEEVDLAVNNLQTVFWCSNLCYDEIVWAYAEEENEDKLRLMSNAYLRVTGNEIEERLRRLRIEYYSSLF
jgi:hypothetical protein